MTSDDEDQSQSGSSTSTTETTTMVATAPLPTRGGTISHLGIYVGGCALTIDYKLKKSMSYRSTFQLRTPKAIATAEKTIYDANSNSTNIKFNGNLEIPTGSVATGKELDKMEFLRTLRTMVSRFGFDTFFYVPLNGEMKFLVDDAHHFNIQEIIDEHNLRSCTTGAHKEYDDYERCDSFLSRLAVESLLSNALKAKIQIRYGHYEDFVDLPGQVYFMMVLDICNSSTDHDIEAATASFKNLGLSNYPGENIEEFTTEALRLIKIMQGSWALPRTLGSDLLHKVSGTSSQYFNRTVFNYLDKVRVMEDKVGETRDPTLLTKDPQYSTYGPIALCSLLQQEYASITKRPNGWPALASKIPQGNHSSDEQTKRPETRDDYSAAMAASQGGQREGGQREGGQREGSGSEQNAPPLGPPGWRFKAPNDANHKLTLQGKTFWWCRHCKCHRTQKVGMYNRTHSTSYHKGPKLGDTDKSGSGDKEKEKDPPKDDAPSKQVKFAIPEDSDHKANLSPVITAPVNLSDDDHVDSDPKGLYFNELAYHAELLNDEDGVWMAATDDPDDIDLSPPGPPTIVTSAVPVAFSNPRVQAAYEEDMGVGGWETPDDSESGESSLQDNYWWFCPNCSKHGTFNNSCSCGVGSFTISPLDMRKADYSDSSSASTYSFGTCMYCNDRGPVYTKCFECEDIFYPDDDSSKDSTLVEEEEMVDSLRTLQLDSSSIDKTKSSTSVYFPTHFEYFDALESLPLFDPLAIFMDCAYDESIPTSLASTSTGSVANYNPPSPLASAFTGSLDSFSDDDSLSPDFSLEPSDDDTLYVAVDTLTVTYISIFADFCLDYFLLGLLLLNQGLALVFHSTARTLVHTIRTIIAIPQMSSRVCLFASALMWDTLILYRHPPITTPTGTDTRRCLRKLRRSGCHPLLGYPRKWALLTGCLAMNGTLGMTHPGALAQHNVLQTYANMSRLQCLVDLNLTTISQYHQIRHKEYITGLPPLDFNDLSQFESPLPPYFEPTIVPEEPLMDQEELQISLDALEHIPPLDEDMHIFLDAFETSNALEEHATVSDFFDCSEPSPSTPFNDMAGLSDICANIFHVMGHDTPDDHSPSLANLPSPAAYNTATSLLGSVDLKPRNAHNQRPFPVIFDSGASLAISPCADDFVGPIQKLPTERRLGGMAAGMLIEGVGTVRWTFQSNGKFLVVNSRCYLVPDSRARLISPQRLFSKKQGISGKFIVEEDNSTLQFDGLPPLTIEYDSRSHLPTALAKNHSQIGSPIQANLAILTEENQNLTPSQKLLLEWHFRFGHKAMPAVQRIFQHIPFTGDRFKAAARCDCPKCATCEFAKGHRRPTKGNKQSTNPHTDGSLRSEAMRAGQAISVDHFESRLLGRTLTSYGKSAADHQYKGGCAFVDHMSSYLHIEHQLGFSSSETIRAKQNFEKLALDHGVIVATYHADNGTFKANEFVSHIRDHNQKISYCGVNAHHKKCSG